MNQDDEINGLTWSTEKINKYLENIDEGIKMRASNPFYEGNELYKRGHIMFKYTNDETLELYKCMNDINYFAEKYCFIKTKEGVQKIILRDYQKDVLNEYVDNEKIIFLAARQSGKCLIINTLVNLEDGSTKTIGEIYLDSIKHKKIKFITKLKHVLYGISNKFSNSLVFKLIEFIEYIEYRKLNLNEKIIESIDLDNDLLIETDNGFHKVKSIHKTKPFYIYDVYLQILTEEYKNGIIESNREWNLNHETLKLSVFPNFSNDKPDLTCADTHILFDEYMNEVFVKDLKTGDSIQTKYGIKKVVRVVKRNIQNSMFDLTIDDVNHRFYSNDILSHNTVMTTIFLAHSSIFQTDYNMLCVSNKGESAKEILAKTRIILENLPFFLKPGVLKNDVQDMKFDNGSRLKCTNTTKRSGVGNSVDCLYIDEMAHIPDNVLTEFWENIFPTVSEMGGKVILTSTPGGLNLFSELWYKAKERKNSFYPIEVQWFQIPGRDQQWYEEQIALIGESGFSRQYSNDFFAGSGLLLSPDQLKELSFYKTNFIKHEFDVLEDVDNIDYLKYLSFSSHFNIDDTKDPSKFYIFSIDLAEGGGDMADYSIINMFEIVPIRPEYFERMVNPTSFQDFFGLDQIGMFRSNDVSIEDLAKVVYKLIYEIFNSENIKIVLEINTYGNEFIKNMYTIFPGRNDFDENVVCKFKHKAEDRIPKLGLKIRLDNKDILAQVFKKNVRYGKFIIHSDTVIEELNRFGKNRAGHYEGLNGKDDTVMTCINACEFFNTIDFAEFVEEKYDNIDDDIREKIDSILDLMTDGDGGDTLQYDLYQIVGNRATSNSGKEINFDF